VGNAADFVAEGRNGYVVGPFDIEEAASKVLSVLLHPGREEMRQFSLEIVKKANYRNSAEAFTRIAAGILGKNS